MLTLYAIINQGHKKKRLFAEKALWTPAQDYRKLKVVEVKRKRKIYMARGK